MTQTEQVLYFTVGHERFGIRISSVSEIFNVDSIEKHPSKLEHTIGITDIRDNVVTVVDTKGILFDGKSDWTRETCMNKTLILLDNLEQTTKQIGLIADSVDKVSKLDSIDTTVFTEDTTIEGVIKEDDEIIPVLDVQKVDF